MISVQNMLTEAEENGGWQLKDERLVATGLSELPWVSVSVLSSLGALPLAPGPSLFHRDCLMPCNEPHNTPRWAQRWLWCGSISSAPPPSSVSLLCSSRRESTNSHQYHLTALVMLVMLEKRQLSVYTDDVDKHPCCLSCILFMMSSTENE